jgi:hypothetical protein
MSYQIIEAALVGAMLVGAVLYAASRWWPASLQPIKRWRKTAAGGCGSGCGSCSSGGGCSTPASPVNQAQVITPPRSLRQPR